MGGITKETRGAFTAAGVNHVLSISGLHVAMLGLVVFGLIRYFGSLSVLRSSARTRACGLISWAAKTPTTGARCGSRFISSR